MSDLHSGYLTGRQLHVWDLLRSGLSQSQIARKLSISRQAVNQLVQAIPQKVTAALSDAAKLNRVEPRYVDSNKGVLFGWSREFEAEVVITLNPGVGLRVWYQHSFGRCNVCQDRRQCKSTLLRISEDLGISLTQQERELEPSRLSSVVFSRVPGRDDEGRMRR